MEEIPNNSMTGNVTNIVLIPDQAGTPNSASVAALQQVTQQIFTIVTDDGQQVSQPVTMFQNIGQVLNSTFTQAMTTRQQPMIETCSNITEPVLHTLTENDVVAIGDGESTEATLAAFEAISVLADTSNDKDHHVGERESDVMEKRVFSTVKASLSKSLVAAIIRRSGSLEWVLTNIATQLSIKNIVCEFNEATGIYVLDGDIKELSKLQDVLVHYYDENLDSNLENVSPGKASSHKKDQGVACNILQSPVVKTKSGSQLKTNAGVESFDDGDVEYEDDDEEYLPPNRAKRHSGKRKRGSSKKISELILAKTRHVQSAVLPGIPDDNFTSILSQVQTGESSVSTLKFNFQPSLLVSPKLESASLKTEDMPAQSNEDVVSLLEKPLEGDDVRKFINISNISGVVQDDTIEAEDFVAKFVQFGANDLLDDGTSVLGEVIEKQEAKAELGLPPVTLSDEEALDALAREHVEEKIRVAKGKYSSSNEEALPKKKQKTRKDYDSLMPYKYHCTQCSFKSKRESHYIKHMQLHRDNPDLAILKCKVCDFKTIRQCHLKRHQAEHTNAFLQCDKCSYKSTDGDLLKKHVATKHPEEPVPSAAKIQQCPNCDYKTSRPYHFERHLRVHADIIGLLSGNEVQSDMINLVQSYDCPKCPYHTKKKEHFVRHLGDVHSPHRPYLCDTCGKSFKRADALKQHREIHVEKTARTLPFTCITCKKSFKSKAHLNDHKTKHTNVRAYLCEICGASFKTKSVQRKHILSIHRNPRAYVCPHCDKRFNTKFALQRHSSTHMVPDGLIRTTDVPITEQEELNLEGQQETQYIQVEVNPSSQLTTIQTIPLMQMDNSQVQVQDVITMKTEDTFVEQTIDGTRIVPQIYSGPGEATTALLYLTGGNFPGSF